MVYKEIKRLVRILIIFWILCGGYFYEFFDCRNLFEYITYLLVGIYICLDVKTKWKYLLLIVLIQNVVEESIMILGDEDINILNNIWISGIVILLSAMIIGLIKEKKTQPQ